VLSLPRSIPNFTLSSNSQGILHCVVSFAFVQADLGAALHVGIQQPIYNE
jgi:hypothetical protein